MSETKQTWAEKIVALVDEWPHRGSDNIAHDIIALVEDEAENARLTARVKELEGQLEWAAHKFGTYNLPAFAHQIRAALEEKP